MRRNIVVLGAGVGGQLAARGIKDNFPNDEVILVGNVTPETHGLFYFNEPIPGVADQEIEVVYQKIGNGTMEDYQKKSRGSSESSVKVSSFSNLDKTVKGYRLNHNRIDLSGIVNFSCNATKVSLDARKVELENGTELQYDKLISTVPLKVFLSISGMGTYVTDDEFKYSPVHEKVVQSMDADFSQVTKIHVYYDLTDSKFYRHSHYYVNSTIYKAVSETIKDNEGCTVTVYPGKIIPNPHLSMYVSMIECNYPSVALCGRYASWSYHYLVSDTYRDAIKHCRT